MILIGLVCLLVLVPPILGLFAFWLPMLIDTLVRCSNSIFLILFFGLYFMTGPAILFVSTSDAFFVLHLFTQQR